MTQPKQGMTVVEASIVVAILLLIAAISLPALVQNHRKRQAALCAIHLDILAKASRDYATREGRYPKTPADLVPEFLPVLPACPAGGTYQLGSAEGLPPSCTIPGHHF